MKNLLLLLVLLTLSVSNVSAQSRNSAYERYINQYKGIAVEQMRKYGVPASITLAQAILESGAGNGELAQRSNNHFGIKRGSDWRGPVTKHTDDKVDEYFRVYNSVKDSYEDHSKFLHKERYQRLYRLSTLDYKGWARGLKACGYATNPNYADKLIRLIELYNLSDLDEDPNVPKVPKYEDVKFTYHAITSNNGISCIIAKEGDTWQSVANEMHMSVSKILKLNEAILEVPIRKGDFVYLEKKATKGPNDMKGRWHKIATGETMYSIAQKYGIRLAALYRMNYKDDDYDPTVGDLLRVR